LVQAVTQPIFYVDANNANPSAPFNSWATSATNIQDAVDAVPVPGSLVLVTNGVYQFGGRFANGSLANRVAVTTPMLVQSINGAAVTIIAGNPVIGDNAARCVYLANGAMLDGFTLTNGATRSGGDVTMENSGGGVRCESANTIVSNCVIAGNLAYNFGGGVEGGTILDSIITGNAAASGGATHGAELGDCNFSLNVASSGGGGAESCTIKNSALTANSTRASGGGADNSALVNCTLSGNYASSSGGGVNHSTLNNCIVYFNASPVGTNFSGGILNFSCTTPLPSVGADNITADPQLTDGAHIGGGSPCIGAGNFNVANGADIDGEAWANPPCIGCDEYHAGPVTTPLAVTAMANYTNVSVGFPVNLSSLISGHATTSSWNFGDSTVASNQIYTAHSWSSSGDYAVTFTAFNDANPGGVSTTVEIHVTSQTIFYVDANGTNPAAPFSSWTTAATNIQDAADVACAGGTILVNDGLYQFGGSVVFGLLTNRVALTRPMNLQSVHGAAATLIAGNPVNDDTAVRGVLLANGCMMTGFTVTNGATRSAGDVNLEQSGGGAWCESADVFVSNCVFAANYVPQYGGGVLNGTFENCTFANNSSGSAGGGSYGGLLNDCTFAGNYGGSSGGGADSSTLNNCTLTGNSCFSSGGGANACVLNNCLIATNSITWGDAGGVSGSVLSNCDLIANASPITAGGAEGCTLNNCRLIGNWAGDEGGGGGGADGCTLNGCLLSGNYIYSYGGGASHSTLNNCTLTNNSCSSDGGGAYDCILSVCTLAGNSAGGYGGGACVSTVNNCALSANTAGYSGGGYSGISGVYFGRGNSLSNCVVFGDSASQNGGGAESCVAVNCTVTGNSASQNGGGADNSTLANCIVYHNAAMTGSNYFGGILNYCCTLPLPPADSGNITNEPQLADFAHISAGSPCRGAGSAAYTGGVDIDGEAWLNPPSIGCDEFYSSSATGALAVSLSEDYTNCASGFVVNFLGQITGHAAACVWDFGDGTIVSNQLYLVHSWTNGGDYTVTLTAFNDSNPGGVSASVVVHVSENPVYYVSLSSTNPIPPFNSWATAATNIQDAVDAAVVGGTVLVTNGDYNTGGRVVFGSMTNRVVVNKPITMTSVNGASVTAIEGFTTNDNTSSIRCLYLTNDATLIGFTLTNGATIQGGDYVHEWDGAGVWCESSRAIVSNCFFVNNTA
jgi:PKD repeat protein